MKEEASYGQSEARRSRTATTQQSQESGARVCSHQEGELGYYNLEEITRKHSIYVTLKQ